MSASIVFHLLAALAYIVLSISLWRPIKQGSTQPVLNRTSRVALLAAIIMHGAGLALTIIMPNGLHLGWALAFSAAIWLGMVVFWFQSLYLRLDSLLLILLPAATLVSIMAALFPQGTIVEHANNEWLRIHLLIALVAYGLSTVAALHAILMIALDKQLHRPIAARDQYTVLGRALDTMPPLLVQEQVLFRLLRVAFIILTLTVLSGFAVSLKVDDQLIRLDHKTIFTLLSWLTFGGLLLGRRIWGWRGRIALRWTLAGFAFLLLAYSGSHFVLEVILQRGTIG
ncbi:cytochrome C assembly family protein [Alcaligenes endophyticus]|uniref:Cytochrome c biogenesis protein CcsA n=1 Tax=Alcaligenes endophyticus TaxID=1929088 RepID=A0ABT8ELX9_9BURK|nr:cytochrome c biogenesis protein CcsA [Alcaligenes endophyticus]MCX5591115.1 cytochrome c biogenesis protein CcsA [Alcaligenes endophyticus]MDN4122307.1 cytochrome c biogenesis protein CcsA [Alcaligenes endophyticus]